jgi:hypothetical protein
MKVRPSVEENQLDHPCHNQEAERREAGSEAYEKQRWKGDFRQTDDEGQRIRGGETVEAAEDVELELFLEQIVGTRRNRQRPSQRVKPDRRNGSASAIRTTGGATRELRRPIHAAAAAINASTLGTAEIAPLVIRSSRF